MFVKLAVDENGAVKVEDGKPIYVNDKDEEVAVDPAQMYQKILSLGEENKKFRTTAEGLSAKYKALESEEDFDAWYEKATAALEQVTNFNEKEWLDVKKVDSMKAQMKEAHGKELGQVKEQFENTITEQGNTIQKKDAQIRKLVVSNQFASCPLFAGQNPKTTMTPEVAEAFFGHHFQVQDDENTGQPIVRCFFDNGDVVYSTAPDRVGEPATFNEGMQTLFDNYPNRDQYLRSKKGSGAQGGNGNDEETTDLAILQQQYNEAEKARNTQLMIALKNKMTVLRQSQTA